MNMKNLLVTLTYTFTILLLGTTLPSQAQLLEKLKRKAEQKVEQAVDKGIDNVGKKRKEKKQKGEPSASASKNEKGPESAENKSSAESGAPISEGMGNKGLWTKYDFLPGEKVIFYDDFKSNDYGDFPARWELAFGSAEVAKLGKEKVVLFRGERPTILPDFTRNDYMTGATTIELDLYCGDGFWENQSSYILRLFRPSSKYSSSYSDGSGHSLSEVVIHESSGTLYVTMGSKYQVDLPIHQLTHKNGWHHLALFTDGKQLRLYFDEHKMLNIPDTKVKPAALALTADLSYSDDILAVKDVKIAKGGEKPYRQITSNGKYVTTGILFDKGKAVLKPSSMGVILKMGQAMEDNEDWDITIVGHTDSDGEAADNLALSRQRADAVKKALTDYGIKTARLSVEGKGESEPLDENTSLEAKANNRRVEFILDR